MLLFPVAIAAVAGCAEIRPDGHDAFPAKRALIGKSKDALYACAGKPASEKTAGDRAVAVYYREASQLEESFGGSKSSFAKVHHGCRATILIEQGRITEVRYQSEPETYRDEDHCEDIFEPCLGP